MSSTTRQPLPVITAMGGINAAGRSGLHFAFQRLVFDALSTTQQQATLNTLARLTGDNSDTASAHTLLPRTLIRALPDDLRLHSAMNATSTAPLHTTARDIDLPTHAPAHWQQQPRDNKRTDIHLSEQQAVRLPYSHTPKVRAAGQLPSGFNPADLYPSRNHPRALQMALFGISDTLDSLALDWQRIVNLIGPHNVAVFASNAMAQLDDNGLGGLMRAPLNGQRITSKQVPLGLGEMTADFLNAYVLRTLGPTGGMLGACATFLYNMEKGVRAIRSGQARIAIIGTSEAPLIAEVIEGYRAMGALAEDSALAALDNASEADLRRACRPFANNCGFTIAESAQFAVLMDDTLALELGADILGSIPDVFIHADGAKKSISAPGVGNFLTVGRAAALTQQLLGERALQQHSMVHAHGTGTPQNRTTESDILSRVAGTFGIRSWPIVAIKAYLGHSLGSAGGDQLSATLGSFAHHILPGITTIDALANDVQQKHLQFCLQHTESAPLSASLINSKGFGGNNATAVAFSPNATTDLLQKRHGNSALTQWQHKREAVLDAKHTLANSYQHKVPTVRYHFDDGVMHSDDVSLTREAMALPGYPSMPLNVPNGFEDCM